MNSLIPRLVPLLKAVARLLGSMYQQMFLFYLLYSILNLILLGPLYALLLNRLIEFSGSQAIGNFDIANYLISPVGMGFLLIAGIIAVALVLVQMAGFMLLGQATLEREARSLPALLLHIGRNYKPLLILSFFAVGVLLSALLPTVGLAWLINSLLLGEHDINYYLTIQPPEFWIAVALGALLAIATAVVVAVFSIATVFALPRILFSGTTVRGALGASLQQLSRVRYMLMLRLVQVGIIWALLTALVNGVVYFAGDLVLYLAGEGPQKMISLAAVFGVNMVVATVLGFVTLSGAAMIVLLLWRNLYGKNLNLVAGSKMAVVPHKRAAQLAAASTLAVVLFFLFVTLDSLDFEEQVLNVAHRGGAKLAPENTMSAIHSAIAHGTEAVEIDVQRTADGVMVVVHDQDMMRVAGQPLKVNSSVIQELRKLDVGAWVAPEFAGEQLPTLEEVVAVTKQAGIGSLIELKSYDDDRARLVHEVVALLKKHNATKGFVIISLNYDELQMVREHYPAIETGYLASAAIGDLTRLDVDFLAVSAAVLSNTMITLLHAEERKICVWTIDTPQLMHSLINRGVDCIITDRPDILARVIAERDGLSPSQRLLLRFGEIYR